MPVAIIGAGAVAMVWIDQAMKRGRGRDFAFALVKMK